MPYCKDCQHYRSYGQWSNLDSCAHPSLLERRDQIRGELIPQFCYEVRSSIGACGSDAKLFEPKESSNA